MAVAERIGTSYEEQAGDESDDGASDKCTWPDEWALTKRADEADRVALVVVNVDREALQLGASEQTRRARDA